MRQPRRIGASRLDGTGRRGIRLALTLALAAFLGMPRISRAVDGVIEINQARAIRGGVTPGDAAGFPVTLSQSGSYRLTGNLSVASAATTAIEVTANDVSIDLNGFAIAGPTVCTGDGASLQCAPLGPGAGVSGSGTVGTWVSNGTIRGMGGLAISVGRLSHVHRVNVIGNGGGGIGAGRSVITECVIDHNDGFALATPGGGVANANVVSDNKGDGLTIDGVAIGNSVVGNGGLGGYVPDAVLANNSFLRDASGSIVDDADHPMTATSGNRCSDGRCSPSGARRYYVTTGAFDGAQAISACSIGFHMASLWEIHETSGLFYDTARGNVVGPDQGLGPTNSQGGWVRSGAIAGVLPPPGIAGNSNCSGWTSASASDTGSFAVPAQAWGAPGLGVNPWVGVAAPCSLALPVWCVED